MICHELNKLVKKERMTTKPILHALTHCDDYIVLIMQYLTIKETCKLGLTSKLFYNCSKSAKKLYTKLILSEVDSWTKQEPKPSLNTKQLLQHMNNFTSARKVVVLGFESTMYFLLFAFKQSSIASNITKLLFVNGSRPRVQPPPKYIKRVFPNLQSVTASMIGSPYSTLEFDDMQCVTRHLHNGKGNFLHNNPQFDYPEFREYYNIKLQRVTKSTRLATR
jgi:hypothetical protein